MLKLPSLAIGGAERIVFPMLVVLNMISLLGLIGTLKLRAKTST